MSIYEDLARIRVESALQEGMESQHAFRNLPARPSRLSRFKDFLDSANRLVKQISLIRAPKTDVSQRKLTAEKN